MIMLPNNPATTSDLYTESKLNQDVKVRTALHGVVLRS